MLSTAWVRFSRSSKLVIKPTISCAPFTHRAACWLNRSKNLPSVGIRRPNMYFSVGKSLGTSLGAAGVRVRFCFQRDSDPGVQHAAVIGLVALVDGQTAAVIP